MTEHQFLARLITVTGYRERVQLLRAYVAQKTQAATTRAVARCAQICETSGDMFDYAEDTDLGKVADEIRELGPRGRKEKR